MDKEGHVLPVLNGNVSENFDVTENGTNVTENVAENSDRTNDVTENITGLSSADKRRKEMIQIMRKTPKITTDSIANMFSVSRMTVSRDINYLTSQGILSREGGDKGGIWIVKETPNGYSSTNEV